MTEDQLKDLLNALSDKQETEKIVVIGGKGGMMTMMTCSIYDFIREKNQKLGGTGSGFNWEY